MQWELIAVPTLIFTPMLVITFAALIRRRRMSLDARIAEQEAAAEAQRRFADIAQRSPVDAMYPHGDPGAHNVPN